MLPFEEEDRRLQRTEQGDQPQEGEDRSPGAQVALGPLPGSAAGALLLGEVAGGEPGVASSAGVSVMRRSVRALDVSVDRLLAARRGWTGCAPDRSPHP